MRSEDRAYRPEPGQAGQSGILLPVPLAQQLPDQETYDFLVGSVIDAGDLQRARLEATRCGVATHEALLAGGLSPTRYAAALASSLGIPLLGWGATFDLELGGLETGGLEGHRADPEGIGLPASAAGARYRVLCADSVAPDALRRQVAGLRARGVAVALATRSRISAAIEDRERVPRLERAVRHLFRRRPVDSAGGVMVWTWQLVAAAVAAGLVIGGLGTSPDATLAALTGVAALPFLCVTLLRLAALREVVLAPRAHGHRGRPPAELVPGAQLPVYSVLVPLLREAGVLPGLVQSLLALDYPRAKLEIILVLEASDLETQVAVLALALPPCFRTVVVPDGAPRTKPKALNFALQFARGEYIVVYDAEDRPQPDQLRRALEVFRHNPQGLGCVQAQLNIYNARASWLTRGIMAQTP
jgi:hypothetical protein